jgi:GNAT superfamily N-acetyltransferase
MPVTVDSAVTPRELKSFVRFPMTLYRNDSLFVPPLVSERMNFFSHRNPLFGFTDVAYFLARDEGRRVVGRVTAHINRRHNELTGERTGFFGFFECERDPKVAACLMAAVESWHRERSMEVVRGPLNFSTNEECGFLADGFDRAPAIMMPYTPAYYLEMMSVAGYTPARNLLAYEYESPDGRIPEQLTRVNERIRKRTGVTVRKINMQRFDRDVAIAFDIYNAAWEDNWGFVPMTEKEFKFQAKDLKRAIDPRLVLLAEKDGVPIAFSLTLPDHNVILKKMGGRLFPFGIFHFIFGRRSIRHVRVMALGVLQEYRRLGVDVLLYHDTFRNGLQSGYVSCEMSWILDDNELMRRAIERLGGTLTKVYRIYEKGL